MSLCTLSQIKIYMSITADTYDDLLQVLIDAASDKIDKLCDRHLLENDYTEYIDGNGQTKINLEEFPINSVESLTIWDYEVDITDDDAFKIYSDQGSIYYLSGFSKGNRNIKVVYNSGYYSYDVPSLTNIPDDLNMLCMQLCKTMYDKTKIDSSKNSEKLGDYSYSTNNSMYISDLDTLQKEIISRYKSY